MVAFINAWSQPIDRKGAVENSQFENKTVNKFHFNDAFNTTIG